MYTLRINGQSFRPKVFAKGSYTVHVGEGKGRKTLKNMQSMGVCEKARREVEL